MANEERSIKDKRVDVHELLTLEISCRLPTPRKCLKILGTTNLDRPYESGRPRYTQFSKPISTEGCEEKNKNKSKMGINIGKVLNVFPIIYQNERILKWTTTRT